MGWGYGGGLGQMGWVCVQSMGEMGKGFCPKLSIRFLKTLTEGAVTMEAGTLFQYFTNLTENADPLLRRWLAPWSTLQRCPLRPRRAGWTLYLYKNLSGFIKGNRVNFHEPTSNFDCGVLLFISWNLSKTLQEISSSIVHLTALVLIW